MTIDNKDFLNQNNILSFTHNAMNTVFNLFIANEKSKYAEQTAFEVFKEIDLLEDQLSRYRPNSDISKINNMLPGHSLVVNSDTLNCLVKSIEIYDLTNGIFDISLGTIIQKWKDKKFEEDFVNDSSMHSLLIDVDNFTIYLNGKINLDLGGIGKGYAADKVSKVLLEWGIHNFLISCGNSTIKVHNLREEKFKWPISISNPENNQELLKLNLSKGSLSSSGIQKGEHIINPLNHSTFQNSRLSCWVFCDDAILSDSLSTAFMILDVKTIKQICQNNEQISSLILLDNSKEFQTIRFGNYFR